MGTRIANLSPINNTDANFRLWINEIHNALIAFGWLQTSDTGQINFSTVTRPSANNVYPGFAIYKMNDSLQATTACFMRLDFGTGNATDVPAVKFQLAIGGTNGSGTLTGTTTSTITITGEASTATSSCVYTSGSTNRFCITAWITGQPNNSGTMRGFVFCVERDKNSSGADQADGINYAYFWEGTGGNITAGTQHISSAGALSTSEGSLRSYCTSVAAQTFNGVNAMGNVRVPYGPFRNPMLGLAITLKSDFLQASINPMTVYGAVHKYLMLQANVNPSSSLNGWAGATLCGWAMLWE